MIASLDGSGVRTPGHDKNSRFVPFRPTARRDLTTIHVLTRGAQPHATAPQSSSEGE